MWRVLEVASFSKMADISPPDGRQQKAGDRKGSRGRRPDRKPTSRRPESGNGNRPNGKSQGSKPQSAKPRPLAPQKQQAELCDANVWRRPPHSNYRQAYAAIDLGTNNCRLLIAKPSDENFVVIDAFSRVVRLGEGLAQTGSLSQKAMDRAVGALKICSDKLRKRNVHLARSVATEACRRADNGEEFIERVRKETGIVLDIISAEEEARLAVLGCHILLEDGIGPAVIFDIGGGSTELVLIENGAPVPHIIDWQSVPWGVVSLTETVGEEAADEAGRRARYAEMKRLVSESFAGFAKRIDPMRTPDLRLLGTSGTVTTLASLHLDLPQYDRRAVDGLIVPASSTREISQSLSAMSPEERRQLPCIGNERADLVVAGCAILEAILDIWPAPRLGVADRGIREGILRSMMYADAEGHEKQQALRPGAANK